MELSLSALIRLMSDSVVALSDLSLRDAKGR
jgi:hypothetical protein